MNRPANPNRDEHRRLTSEGNNAAGRGDYAECQRLWNEAARLKAEGQEQVEAQVMALDPWCSHCGARMRGSAAIIEGAKHYNLCHPDEGMDCYRLVTIYKHPVRDCPCVDGSLPGDLDPPAIPL